MKHIKSKDQLVEAKYIEWQASLFGAIFAAFGVGVLLQSYIGSWAWPIIIVGVLLHSWGMSKTYKRNK